MSTWGTWASSRRESRAYRPRRLIGAHRVGLTKVPPVAEVRPVPRLEQVTVSSHEGDHMSERVSVPEPGDEIRDEIRSVMTDVLEKGPADVEPGWLACGEGGLLGLALTTE